MDSLYLLDNEPVDFTYLIKKAKAYGYHSPSGIYQTSIAARILRENGHTVSSAIREALAQEGRKP